MLSCGLDRQMIIIKQKLLGMISVNRNVKVVWKLESSEKHLECSLSVLYGVSSPCRDQFGWLGLERSYYEVVPFGTQRTLIGDHGSGANCFSSDRRHQVSCAVKLEVVTRLSSGLTTG